MNNDTFDPSQNYGPDYDAIKPGLYPALMVSAERRTSTFQENREYLSVTFVVAVGGSVGDVELRGNANLKKMKTWLGKLGVTSAVNLKALNIRCLASVEKVSGSKGTMTVVRDVFPPPPSGSR